MDSPAAMSSLTQSSVSFKLKGIGGSRRGAEPQRRKDGFCCAHSRAIHFLTVLSVKNSVALRLCVWHANGMGESVLAERDLIQEFEFQDFAGMGIAQHAHLLVLLAS